MKKQFLFLLFIPVLILALSSCKQRKKSPYEKAKEAVIESYEDLIDNAGELLSAVKEAGYAKQEEIKKSVQDYILDLDARIKDLEKSLKNTPEDHREKIERKIELLQNKMNQLAEKARKLGSVTKDNWDEFRENLSSQINQLNNDMKELEE